MLAVTDALTKREFGGNQSKSKRVKQRVYVPVKATLAEKNTFLSIRMEASMHSGPSGGPRTTSEPESEHTKKPKNHRDLWEKIPDFKPMEFGDILRPCRESEFEKHEGFDKALIYKFINPKSMMDLPQWTWDNIFTYVDEPK